MLQVLACHFQLIYELLPFQNASLLKSIKRYFNGPHGTYNQFSAPGQDENATCVVIKATFLGGCKELRAHFLPLYQPKMRFRWSRKSDVSSCRMSLWSLFLLLDHVTLNSFSASWQSQNATFLRSRSDVSRARMELTTNYRPLDLPKS